MERVRLWDHREVVLNSPPDQYRPVDGPIGCHRNVIDQIDIVVIAFQHLSGLGVEFLNFTRKHLRID